MLLDALAEELRGARRRRRRDGRARLRDGDDPGDLAKPDVPTIGFIAHVDTSPEMSGAGVKPIVHRGYDGRDLVLPDDPSAVLRLADNPGARPSASATTSSPPPARRCSAPTTRRASRRS